MLSQIREIFETYRRHDWLLRRILLKNFLRKDFVEYETRIPVFDSDIDAAWFSRPPASGGVAWEIRSLGDPPLALLENLDEADANFEEQLKEIENRLKKSTSTKT